MIDILSPNDLFVKLIGKQQKADGISYRLLTYCLQVPTDSGLLIYNLLSCQMIKLSELNINNWDVCADKELLIEQWFLVPENFDDENFAKQYINIRRLLKSREDTLNHYTILTTTDCNARCFYCYEKGRSRIKMTQQTANDVADYIIRNYQSTSKDDTKDVTLSWFGGEPLYNNEVIDIICEKLISAGVPYSSKMISNGYLFDANLIDRAVNIWKLKRVQITLDGTEDTYNRSKAYIYKEESAYKRVMHNIGMLLDAGIKVIVRMNIDMHNADDLMALAHELKEKYSDKKGLRCYSHPLFEVASPTATLRSDERRQEIYLRQNKLKRLLDELGLLIIKKKLPKDIRQNLCMADNDQCVVIAPTGQIGLCEHYSDSEFFSHINTPEQRDETVVARFRERCEDLDLCHDCPVYPQCIRLKMCQEGSHCFPEIRAEKIEDIKNAMLAKYNRWKAKQEDTEEDAFEEC